jgi:hypothetical protein
METALITRLEHLFTLGLNEQTFDVMIGHLVIDARIFSGDALGDYRGSSNVHAVSESL